MTTLVIPRMSGKHSFDTVVEPFMKEAGLPFSEAITAEEIEQVFAERGALFAQDGIYSTQIVLWAFLSQVLQDGKGAACRAAVARVAAHAQQMGHDVPCGDTGDYSKAREKLDPDALRELVKRSADQLEDGARPEWRWHGLHPKLVDGFTFTMMDSDANQARFPQPRTQKPGVGSPIARACVILSLATAAIHDLAVGPYKGKETGESALLRRMLDDFGPDDVAVFDGYFGSYFMLALLQMRGVHACTRLHHKRDCDFRKGDRLGKCDHLVTWRRPPRPEWMSQEQYAQIPKTMRVRELEYTVDQPGSRSEKITVVTTLTDSDEYSKEDIAELYGYRWHVELDIRAIKSSLHLDLVSCKKPTTVLRHLWVTMLAYNLIRKLTATAAAVHGMQPRQMSFTFACQEVLAAWMLISTGASRDPRGAWEGVLKRIASKPVANRPGRIEPRVVKRRPKPYPLMQQPRKKLQEALMHN